jgi:hypothetical protein
LKSRTGKANTLSDQKQSPNEAADFGFQPNHQSRWGLGWLVRRALRTPTKPAQRNSSEKVSTGQEPVQPVAAPEPGAQVPISQPSDRDERQADGNDGSQFSQVDLSQVAVHTGSNGHRAARMMGAQAFTYGNHIVLGDSSESSGVADQELMAHELTHVAQQADADRPIVQRRVAPDFKQIEDNLTYSIIDWAITDAEAIEVLNMLAPLSDRDLADTVAAMDREGLVNRLLDNIPEDQRDRYAVLIGRINRRRSVTHSADWIIDRLSYGFFDWAITDEDANQALQALMGLDYQQLRTLVAKLVNKDKFDELMEQLPEKTLKRYAAFIQRLKDLRDEFESLVKTHVSYLRSRPGGAGKAIKKTVTKTGYGGAKADWVHLDGAVKRKWRKRAKAVIKKVRESVKGVPELKDILDRAELKFKPKKVEELSAYAFVHGENTLFFGREWIENAEDNVKNVWQSIAHELGGHEEFGSTWSWQIMEASWGKLTPAERKEANKALKGGKSLYSAYGYLETELYAELRELPHRVPGSGGDEPASRGKRKGDVYKQLKKIKNAFGPDVGRTIVARLYYRVMDDPRVTDEAKKLLFTEAQAVFGLFPLPKPLGP